MSRAFAGGVTADRIIFSIGGSAVQQTDITIAALVKITSGFSGTGWIIDADDGSFVKFGMLTSGGPLFLENDFGGGTSPTTGNWCWVVGTHVSGSNAPRWHVHDLTAGTAWSHSNGSAAVGNLTGSATEIIVGGQFTGGASTGFRGSMAALATWNSVLTDLQVEAACTLAALDLKNANPGWAILLNQSSTATPVPDIMGHGGDQSSISGTSIDASDPPGFSYSLSASIIPNGQAVPVNLGSQTAALGLSATPNGQAIPVNLGNQTVALGLSTFPSGQVIPVALGQPTVGLVAASPSGQAIPVALGQHTAALGQVATPSGQAIPVALGQPSTLPPVATDGRTRPLVASRTARVIVASTSARRLTA